MKQSQTLFAADLFCLLASSTFAYDPLFIARRDYGTGDRPFSFFAADLDSDGDSELAVANWNSDNVSILRNNGDGSFAAAVNYSAKDYPYSVCPAGLNRGGVS